MVWKFQSNEVQSINFLNWKWSSFTSDIMYSAHHIWDKHRIMYCDKIQSHFLALLFATPRNVFLIFICFLSIPVVLMICLYKSFLSFLQRNKHISGIHQIGILILNLVHVSHHPQRSQFYIFCETYQLTQSSARLRTITYTSSTTASFVVHLIRFPRQFSFWNSLLVQIFNLHLKK